MMFDGGGQPTHRERWSFSSLTYPSILTHLSNGYNRLADSISNSPTMNGHNHHKETEMSQTNRNASSSASKTHLYQSLPNPVGNPSPYHHLPVESNNAKKKLGLAALTVLIFYEVSGGPFGIEDIVKAGGPFYALVGFSLLLVWAVPEALITAELSTAMPEASGSVAWVDEAFGPFWAFQKGWLSWLSGVSDNALYPILFLDCLVHMMSTSEEPSVFSAEGGNPFLRMTVIMSITVSLTYLTYRGLDIVGTVAIGICLLSLMPFVVFCVLGASKVEPSRWLIGPVEGIWGVNWRLLLNTFFWNINYWESAACFSGEVDNPSRTYPLGMLWGVLLVFMSLFIPVLIGTGASTAHYSEWTDGYFIQLAREIVGPWLSYWLLLASALTNIGMFVAEMSSDSWQIAGMSDRGILPAALGKRNQYDTPTWGAWMLLIVDFGWMSVLLCSGSNCVLLVHTLFCYPVYKHSIIMSASGILCLGWLNFTQIIDMLNLLFCLGQIIEFCAFLHLRRVKPDLPRPFKIPIGLVALLGVVVYWGLAYAKREKWCVFEDKFEDFDQSRFNQELALIANNNSSSNNSTRNMEELGGEGVGGMVGGKLKASEEANEEDEQANVNSLFANSSNQQKK